MTLRFHEVRDELRDLLAMGETQTVEFKTSFDRETIETLVAFSNAQGGRVLVGVNDRGGIVGVSLGKETLNQWLGQVKSATAPALIPHIEAVDFSGKTLVVLSVGEYPVKPVNTRGR